MHKMWNSSKFLENTWKNLAHGPQFGPMGLSNFQIQRLGRAWAKMIRPRPIVGQTPKMALLRPGPGQAGPGPGPNSSLIEIASSAHFMSWKNEPREPAHLARLIMNFIEFTTEKCLKTYDFGQQMSAWITLNLLRLSLQIISKAHLKPYLCLNYDTSSTLTLTIGQLNNFVTFKCTK